MNEKFLENSCTWAPGDRYQNIYNSQNLESTLYPSMEGMSKLCPSHMESSTATFNQVAEFQLENNGNEQI